MSTYSHQKYCSCDCGSCTVGDFDGNGKLDNADYQALRAVLVEKGVL